MRSKDTKKAIIERRGFRKDVKGGNFSLYISNYPVIARYLKERLSDKNKTLAELCCGVGITLEYIGFGFKSLVGIDIDKKILSQCKENLSSAGLIDRTVLICADIENDDTLRRIKADMVIYDVPFWSPHKNKGMGDLTQINPDLKSMINRIRKFVTKDIVIFCPPNHDYKIVKKQVGVCEYERVFVNGKYDRNHIYLGNLAKKEGITEIRL